MGRHCESSQLDSKLDSGVCSEQRDGLLGKTVADFADLQFSDPLLDPNLSTRIDEVAYGK